MKKIASLFLIIFAVLISGCSPHPATGVWKSTQENDYGVSKLVVAFDGKAEFVSKKLDNAIWHCFWAAKAKQQVELKCKPSTNTEKEESFKLLIDENGFANLSLKSQLISTFELVNENPKL